MRPDVQHPPRARPGGRAARRPAAAGLLLAALLAAGGTGADERADHERARTAVQSGEVLPLPVLLQRLQATHPGRLLELELEREDGRWIYELKLLQAGGQLLRLEVDAATGRVLKERAARADKPQPAAPGAR